MKLDNIFDMVGSLIVSIENHRNQMAKMHPESNSYHVTQKKIRALTAAKDGLQSYISNMEKFWEADSEMIPAILRDQTKKALESMRDSELKKFSEDSDVSPEAQSLARMILSERFLNRRQE